MTYRGLEVFSTPPDFTELEPGQTDDFTFSAGGFGPATPWKASGATRRQVTLPLLLESRAAIAAYRKFLDRHRGRLRPFWVPTWCNEFALQADAAAAATQITVAGHGFATLHARGVQYRFIALLTRAGKLECYGVTAVTASGDDDRLTLSRGLDTALSSGETVCAPLLLARCTEDAIEFGYLNDEVARVNLEAIELPREYPAATETASATDTAHFGTRPVFLYRFTGTSTLLLADYGVDVTAKTLTWLAADITGGDWVSSTDLLGDTVTLTLQTDDAAHPLRAYLDALYAANFHVEVFLADLDNLEALDLATPIHSGRIESVNFSEGGGIEVEVSSLFRIAEMRIPKLQFQRLCNWRLGEGGCQANAASFTTAGTISALNEDPAYVEASAFGAKATAEDDPNWFALGKVTCGAEVRLCTGTNGNRLYLNYPFRTAEIGDAISALAGDDKRIATCQNKFNQLSNFFGFPYMPATNPTFEALETPGADGGKK